MLHPILEALKEIHNISSDPKVSSMAMCYINAIRKFEFLMALHTCVLVFGITRPLSVQLQSTSNDIASAVELVDLGTKSLST